MKVVINLGESSFVHYVRTKSKSILEMGKEILHVEISRIFGISEQYAGAILNGKYWN